MNESKQIIEKIYVIPLRKKLMRVPNYKKTRRAIIEIKKFVARHMKIKDGDLSKVKLDVYFNNEIWSRGTKNPPNKIKIKAIKESDFINLTFVEEPEKIRFQKSKQTRFHKKTEKKKEEPKIEEKKEEKTNEIKKEEVEKEKSAAIVKEQIAEKQKKEEKHINKIKAPEFHRMALKK